MDLMMPGSTPLIYNIQYLRFFAASMVVVQHGAWANGPIEFATGAAGVDIFFVISGFVMVFITENKERSPIDFFLHRLVRVAPPYWFVTLAMATGLLLLPHAFSTSVFSLPHVLASLFFLPYPHPATQEIEPLYAPGWTLNYEFFFYSLFALALAVNFSARALLVSAVLLMIGAIGSVWPVNDVAYTFYTSPILIEFIFGMTVASLVNRGVSVGMKISGALLVAGVMLLAAGALYWPVVRLSGDRFIVWGIPAALIVAGGTFLELSAGRLIVRPLLVLGDASYAIYVTHFMLWGPIVKMWEWVGLPQGWLRVIVIFIISIAVGVAFHFTIEKRLVSFFSPKRSPVKASV